MEPITFFNSPKNIAHKQYEALRLFFITKASAQEVAKRFGYSLNSFYSLTRNFRKSLSDDNPEAFFFVTRKTGRKPLKQSAKIKKLIIALRKKYLSVQDIKAVMDVQGYQVSEKYVYNVIQKDGFGRLPRRQTMIKQKSASSIKLQAPKSFKLDYSNEKFGAQNTLGALCLLPYIQTYGIDRLIKNSQYPETETIDKLSSILSFVALKLSNVKRYASDDAWCMDRGIGFFAGLNVLPKTAWYTSYSDRITREMNRDFLKGLHRIWLEHGFLSDTANIDFTTIPYWGDTSHLENNWSGTRNKALPSVLAVLAQDPESGIITYGDTTLRHENQSNTAIEFLDFYRQDCGNELKYLVFDSKFTTYKNLAILGKDIKFLTIRRRGKKVVEELESKPASEWKRVRVPMPDGKGRYLKVSEDKIFLKEYGGEVRQIAITGNGKIKPALLISNDFNKPRIDMIRKYARRWLVEKSISEQIEFFHLNKVSSSMVIKVDFDLTMSVLTHNILRIFAMDLIGCSHYTDYTLFNKFLSNTGTIQISDDQIFVKLKKKRNLPRISGTQYLIIFFSGTFGTRFFLSQ